MNVLFVCTANQARSPMAAALAGPGCHAASAGTQARDGLPMTAEARAALRRHGHDPADFQSRRLTRDLIARADLILTMEGAHRAAVLGHDPGALRRTFTLREFARLVAADPVPPAGSLVDVAAARRGTVVPAGGPGEDDIADPTGRGRDAHDACAALIAQALLACLLR
jgi:low molecular weight protein-tyrosine phosphatase